MITTTTRSSSIVESSHSLVRRIRHLHLREERERTGLFYIEGMRFIAQALHHKARIETLVVCQDLLLHPFARKLVRLQKEKA